MKIQTLSKLSYQEKKRVMQRSRENIDEVIPIVKDIINDVKINGDKALKKYTMKFDKTTIQNIKVSSEDIKKAYGQVDNKTILALKQTAKNIQIFQKAQLKKRKRSIVKTETGIKVWQEWRPIAKIGLYIPGGKAAYPSTVLMTAIPAKIAGCSKIVMVSPPDLSGKINANILVAADIAGISEIYKVGGAQAIAALAYGTKTIPKVSKIFGPGNRFVSTAKVLVSQDVAIDMPAGPSEVCIIADETANPSYIAADLLADGEHAEDSACVLVTTSQEIAEKTIAEIKIQLKTLSTADRIRASLKNYGLIAISKNMDEAIKFANDYAPEHLEIMTKNNRSVLKKIMNVGSVFLGDWTSKSSGDYATGANHVLPTGGMAKMFSPLGVEAFGRWIEVQKCTKSGLRKIRKTITLLSEAEGLPAHKVSTEIRFLKNY
ncbi:MAG: histidinol dehydrogenase [Candidatus Roizmanbacteria bacterium]|nr:histidinol dehydrogenase [Candidatus Roizmanbacteria bacterium]